MLQKSNQIARLEVQAFKKPDRRGEEPKKFLFWINPDTFNSRHQNQFSRARGINTSGRTAPYVKSMSEEVTLTLTIDNTLLRDHLETSGPTSSDPVKKQVDNFLTSCFFMDGDIHEPRFLRVIWGTFNFECRLKSVHVSFSHFNAAGDPLRAKLDTVFVSDMPAAKRILKENKKSPDITHARTILAGQTLTGLTTEVYGDPAHYLEVAKANRLNHFRILKPGEKLRFPPLEK